MTISFVYFFNLFFIIDLVEGIFLVLVYLMFIFSSKNQPQENNSSKILKVAGFFGIAITVLTVALPTIYCLNCGASEIFIAHIFGFSFTLISLIPMLLCLGVALFLVGNRNEVMYGKILMISGILWMVTFLGYAFGYFFIAFTFISILLIVGWLSYLSIPAIILMIVHGARYKDRYFVLAGVFYVISWFVVVFLPWLPYF